MLRFCVLIAIFVLIGCAPSGTTITGKVKEAKITYYNGDWDGSHKGWRTTILFEDGRSLEDLIGLADVKKGDMCAVVVNHHKEVVSCKKLGDKDKYEVQLDEHGNTITINGEPVKINTGK